MLRRHCRRPSASRARISLRDLEADDRDMVLDILGEGDVWAKVGGAHLLAIVGIGACGPVAHRGERAQDGTKSEWLEVADVPQADR